MPDESRFTTLYAQLNAAQRKAVDHIEGPLMVVAGPGTGKTQLLSMRVANILQKTDALASNILCLTFTESGATAMRERLASIIGHDAYKVAIHTFHSFGAEIINTYGEYFYHGAHFRAADELSTYELLLSIFEKLPHDNPLRDKMNDTFSYLRDTQSAIGYLKKSALTPEEFGEIIDRNERFIHYIQPHVEETFSPRLSKKSFEAIEHLVDQAEKYQDDSLDLINYVALSEVFGSSLRHALDEAYAIDKTSPIAAWKKQWIERRRDDSQQTLKDEKNCHKLRAVGEVYYRYLRGMQERQLYDFDDMILRSVHALEIFNNLRLDLQEQYQYILVDEFQDTNDAQWRLLWNLTNNPNLEGRPNLMVVGDDDQAIYRFQGAELSNILQFNERYKDVSYVTLTENYRSTKDILSTASNLIKQGTNRLENRFEFINKQLQANNSRRSSITYDSYGSSHEQYQAIATKLADIPRDKTSVIIARNHRQLENIAPYLQDHSIVFKYERQDDVLRSEPVQQLELLARIVIKIARQEHHDVDALIPQLLAHRAWGITPTELWKLSVLAYRERRFWLELMLDGDGRLKDIAEWLILMAAESEHQPLEAMIDTLFGSHELQTADDARSEVSEVEQAEHEEFTSPLRAYFFPAASFEEQTAKYIEYLNALRSLRQHIREYRPDSLLKLSDLVGYIELHRSLNLTIHATSTIAAESPAVILMTAHKSKGLEFDNVFVIDTCDSLWGESSRSRSGLIKFTANLPLAPSGDTTDERLRLLYVALTRAKINLHLTLSRRDHNGKELLPVGYMIDEALPVVEHAATGQIREINPEESWHENVLSVEQTDARELLFPLLEKYRLSATHFNNFLDVTKGGPQLFMLQNLLRFPQSMSPHAAYGSTIHAVLQRSHSHLSATGKRRPLEDSLHDFENELSTHQLSEHNFDMMHQRGTATLEAFFRERYDTFTVDQVVEANFRTESIVVGDARLTGAIDLIDTDGSFIIVTDYKTGKPSLTWSGRTEYEKIKLYHYRQQLIFYKLLIEQSRRFRGKNVSSGVIEFVEPTPSGRVACLELEYDKAEIERTIRLIQAVWHCILKLDFPDTGKYPETLKGIIAFEDDLLKDY